MAIDVTIHCRPEAQIAMPPVCCYCLEPAATTCPVYVWTRKVRVSRHVRSRRPFPIQIPYCAAHAEDSQRFNRFDRMVIMAIGAVAVLLLLAIDLTLGQALRQVNGTLWWCATVLAMALLALAAAGCYQLARRFYQRRHPAIVAHYRSGSLGVRTFTQRAYEADDGSGLRLVETFTFFNPEFARRVAALNGVDAKPASNL
jgi:hypothetical protein